MSSGPSPENPVPAGAEQPRILFATIAAGGSHVASAQAMLEAVATHYPGHFKLELSEIMREYGFAAFDKHHKRTWVQLLRYPKLLVWGQRLINTVPRLVVALQRRSLLPFAERAAEILRRDPPDLVVVNHGWLATALTLAQRRFGLDIPVVTFQTSTLDATALWADPDVERIMLGSPVAKRILMRLGVSSDKMDVVGYPIKQAFLYAPDKATARTKLGLQDTFTCLVSLGGEGVGGSPRAALTTLRTLTPPVQIMVIAGRNVALKADLEEFAKTDPLLKVEGFVTNMADYVAASDVVIGKTGPAAVFEALAVGRPVVATAKSGGIENTMIAFLEAKALGAFAPTPDALRGAVTAYRDDAALLERVALDAAQLDFPDMNRRVAAYLSYYAQHRAVDPALVGQGIDWTL